MPRGTQDPNPGEQNDLYGTLTRSGAAFQLLRVVHSPLVLVLQPRHLANEMMVWALPGSLATTTGISVDFSSSGY